MIHTSHRRSPTESISSPASMRVSPKQHNQRSTGGKSMAVSSHSSLASKAISEGNYSQALDHYQMALDEYLHGESTVVELVNAAATCFNLGALSKKLQDFPQAADYFCQAEELYKSCFQHVKVVPGQEAGPSQGAIESSSCAVCLLQLTIETIQARAHLHYKYQTWLDDAIECHEQVVEVLEQHLVEDREIVHYKIHFTQLPEQTRWQLLITSLQSLGKFYVERGDFEDGLVAYQEALSVLKEQDSVAMPTKQRQDEITQIIKALSDIYLQKGSSTIRLPQMQRLALLQEDVSNWDKALNCWERVLYLQSQEYGEESTQVADTLCQIARVMVAQGNREGALDLYHAATAKYRATSNPPSRELMANIVSIFCQLEMYSEGHEWLDDLGSHIQTAEQESWIHCERGRIFLEEGMLNEASQALCVSAELCEPDDEEAFKLLQRLEFLQQRQEAMGSGIDMVLDSIMEDDESSAVTQEQKDDIRYSGNAPVHLDITPEESPLDDSDEPKQRSLIEHRVDDSYSMVGDDPIDLCRREDPQAELSAGFNHDTTTRDPPTPKNSSYEERPHQRVSPIPSEASNNATTPIREHALTPDESDHANLVTPNTCAERPNGVQEHKVDGHSEDESKSTEETEPSLASSPDRDPNDREIEPQSTVEASVALTQETPNPTFSYDGTESDSGMYFHTRSEDDDAEVDSSTSASSSRFSLGSTDDEDATEDVEKDEDLDPRLASFSEKASTDLSSTQEPAHRKESSPPSNSKQPTPRARQSDSPLTHSRSGETKEKSSNPKALRIPNLASTRTHKGKERQEQTETNKTPRNRIVKALSSPFRRSRSKRQLHSNGLDALDEDKEVKMFNQKETSREENDDEPYECPPDAPVPFIAMRGSDDDDRSQVSQITFKMEEQGSRRSSQDGQRWWGVTAEGLEGWFPSSYVNQAVEAAEGFLSAKSIHERVKSRPLDFDSDDESEENEDSSMAHTRGKTSTSNSAENKSSPRPESLNRKQSVESTRAGSVGAVAQANSVSSKKATSTQIEEKVKALEEARLVNGSEHISVASVLYELAVLYCQNGDIPRAIEHAKEALQIQKATLNLTDACKSLHFIADIHARQKQYQASLSCYAEAQSLQEAVFGYFHEETANTLNRIGNVLARKGEFMLAMENHKEALRILKECFGEDPKNPSVSQTLIQIGAVYYKERNSLATIQANTDGYRPFIESGMLQVVGRAHEERGSYRMAIAFFEEKLQFLDDSDDSDELEQVAETLNSLGMLSCRAGLYLEAIDYYDKALGIQMKLGCDDVQLAMARVLAGSVQYSLGHFKKALKLFEDAIRTLRDHIGQEQETVAATLFHMGVVRVALCDFDNAMSDLRNALKTQKKLLGNEHPATLRTRREVGNLYAMYESELDSAFEEYDIVLEAQKRIHGERHPNVAETLHSIGCAQARKGDYSLALRTLEGCYNMRLEFLGTDHPLQATTLHEIAKIQLERGRIKKAIHICESALTIRSESLSERHVDVAVSMATKASCLVAKGNFTEGNKLFLESLSVAEEAVGPTHPTVANIKVQMGKMHLRKCHFDEASDAIKSALDTYRASNLDEDHPDIREALKDLERVERAEMLCV